MDQTTKDELTIRLKRIAGQVSGIQKMIEDGRRDADVMVQLHAVRAAVAKVAHLVLTAHVKDSVAALPEEGSDLDKKIEDLVRFLYQCQG